MFFTFSSISDASRKYYASAAFKWDFWNSFSVHRLRNGQRLTDEFDEIKLTIDKFKWYLLPIEIKRMLPMIKANAQEPVPLECFGSIVCIREVFKNVGID